MWAQDVKILAALWDAEQACTPTHDLEDKTPHKEKENSDLVSEHLNV